MSRRFSLVIAIGLACVASASAPGCTSGVGLAAPRSMNHPFDVAFACFDTSVVGAPRVVPLSNCAMRVDVPTNSRLPPANPGMHMHALVTQTTRGEVGAVDLIAHTVLDSDMSVPGYTFVPVGELPTQIVVRPMDGNGDAGAFTEACTYVASRGAVDGRHPGISIVDTRRFRAGADGNHASYPLHRPYILPAAPADMVLSPDQGSLWVALDSLGVVARIPIRSSCELGPIDLVVPLFEDIPAPRPYTPDSSADLTYACGLTDDPIPADVRAPRQVDYDPLDDPEPVAIEIDAERGWLLVADRTLPMIHVVNLADGTLAAPIATGMPVLDVAVTPRVPDSYAIAPDPHAPCPMPSTLHAAGSVVPAPGVTFSRYLYAIDATDGSVMAIEYTDPSETGVFGEVIPVDVRGPRSDRIAMNVAARSLEVVTPQYDTTAADPRISPSATDDCAALVSNPSGFGLCLPSDPVPSVPPTPQVLRGVFLAVAGADGGVRFVDVYDLDAPCRGRTHGNVSVMFGADGPADACTVTPRPAPTVSSDLAVYIRRHRPRSAQVLTTFVTMTTGPTVFLPAGGNIVLDELGRAPTTTGQTDHSLPSLIPLGGPPGMPTAAPCPDSLGMVWGQTDDEGNTTPIVCSLVEPFAAIPETWSATYEGVIPGTITASANAHVVGGAFDGNIDTRTDYCQRGVIGRVEAEAGTLPTDGSAPEAAYHGDMLALTGTMPDANVSNMAICRSVLGITNVGETLQPVLARIDHAFERPTSGPPQQSVYTGRLFIDPSTPIEDRVAVDGHVPTIADAIQCYGDTLLTIEVRSFQAFTVVGTRSGLQSNVVRTADGTCAWDTGPGYDRLRQAHAFDGVLYQGPRIAFRPTGAGARSATTSRVEIRMALSGGPSQLGIDLGASSSGVRGMALPGELVYSPEMWALYAIETERRGLVEMTLRPLSVTATSYQ